MVCVLISFCVIIVESLVG